MVVVKNVLYWNFRFTFAAVSKNIYCYMNMNKILKVAVLVGVLIAITYWRVESSSQKTKALILQNVEALADRESADMNTDCYGVGSLDCPESYNKVEYLIGGYSLD